MLVRWTALLEGVRRRRRRRKEEEEEEEEEEGLEKMPFSDFKGRIPFIPWNQLRHILDQTSGLSVSEHAGLTCNLDSEDATACVLY